MIVGKESDTEKYDFDRATEDETERKQRLKSMQRLREAGNEHRETSAKSRKTTERQRPIGSSVYCRPLFFACSFVIFSLPLTP